MPKIFKQEHVNKTSGTVRIPDAVFEIPVYDAEEAAKITDRPVVTKEMYRQIVESVRSDMYGTLDKKKLIINKQCDDMLNKARAEADEIVNNARIMAERITDAAKSDADSIKLDAYDIGKREGIEENAELLNDLSDKILSSLNQIKADEEEYFEKYEAGLRSLALEMTEKIICQKMEDDDLFMYNVIKSAVKSLRDVSWVRAEVSDQLSGYIDSLENELSSSGHRVELVIRENVPKDTCVLNHSDGVVIATLSEQLHNLREFVQKFDKDESNEN